ncbi:MAG TPA: hypothetical protein VGK24_03610 [Candidatus Angelobacter sp.]|jgi:hypothetical protein
MLKELKLSFEAEFYYSKQFSELGHREYPRLFLDALASGNPDTLDEALNQPGIFKPNTSRKSAQAFIWDEFNKYYMRALCLWVQQHPGYELVVVRGRRSETHRDSSDARLGRTENSKRFLDVLRRIPKVNPFGANSGLTLMIQKRKKLRKAA